MEMVRVGDRVEGLTVASRWVTGVIVQPLPHETAPTKGPAVRVLADSGRRVWVRRVTLRKVKEPLTVDIGEVFPYQAWPPPRKVKEP